MSENSVKKKWFSLHRWQRWTFIATMLLAFYTVFGFFILPVIVCSQLESRITKALQRQTTVEKVKFNPFSLQCEINGFQVAERQNKEVFVGFDSLNLNVQGASIFKLAIIVKSISLKNPVVNLSLHEDQTWNFSDLILSAQPGENKEDEKKGKNLLFSLNNIVISGGQIHFNDQVKNISHEISNMNLAIPYLSDLPSDIEIFITPAFNAVINGTPISMKGDSKPFHESRHSELDINFKDIDLTKYLAYMPDTFGFIVHSGLLDLSLAFNFINHEDSKPAVKIGGSIGLRKVDIRDHKDQLILSFPEMSLDIDQAHILRKEFHFSQLSLSELFLDVRRLQNGKINLTTLFPAKKQITEKETESVAENPVLITLKQVLVDKAHIDFTDQAIPGSFKTSLHPLTLQIQNYSTVHDNTADFNLSFISERAEKTELKGTFSSSPLQLIGELGLNNIQIDKYRPYFKGVIAADLKADATNFKADIEFAPEEHIFMVTNGGLEVKNFSMVGKNAKEKIIIPGFAFSGASVDLTEHRVSIDKFQSRDGKIPLFRRADGSLNVLDFLVQQEKDKNLSEKKTNKKDQNPDKWLIMLKNIGFSNYTTVLTDQVPAEPAVFHIDRLNIKGVDITNEQNKKGRLNLDLRLNKTTDVKIGGKIALVPLKLDFDVGVKNLSFKTAQPYMDGKINGMIASGTGDLTGNLSLAQKDKTLSVKLHGNVDSKNFSLLDEGAQKVLSWQNLLMQELDIIVTPMRVTMETLEIDGLESIVAVKEDGSLNLASLVSKNDNNNNRVKNHEENVDETGESAHVEISQIKIINSRLNFTDSQVSPPFSASFQDVNGQITGLSSGKDVLADIDISAKLDQYSPMSVTGKIHPWQDFYTDLKVGIHDIELSPMSPYTIKFIGYPLSKGKLSLDLHYLVEGKKLSSENKVFIDQITLGDFIKNDTAASLPLPLAISLLKNRAGEINLDIPVSGELDDPEFSIASVIFTVIKNLIVKAATAPFALLGSLFPEDRDFLYVEFESGNTNVIGRDEDEWTAFAKAMYEHPSLKLEVTGFIDPEKDGKAMTKNNFDRQLKVQKLKDIVKQEKTETEVKVADVVIASEEYEKYLKKAYKAADFKKPRNLVRMLKSLPPAEMEKLIYEHIIISDEDLHKLGMARAAVIKNFLVQTGSIEPERIFLLNPKNSQPDDKVPALRAEIVAK